MALLGLQRYARYHLEIDEHEGSVISRQLTRQLDCFLGKQMKTRIHHFTTEQLFRTESTSKSSNF